MEVTLRSTIKGILLAVVMGLASNYGRTMNDHDLIERIEKLEAICPR